MSINIWKVSSIACAGLLVTAIAWNRVPTASADQSQPPTAFDRDDRHEGACEDQDHMRAALENLRAARHELHMAEHNKGDHRRIAIERSTEAIRQVKEGCHFADDRRDSE